MSATTITGPLAYRNWLAMRRDEAAKPDRGFEVLLYGDSPATGGNWNIGPYEVMNTVSAAAMMTSNAQVPPLVLRVWQYLDGRSHYPPLTETNVASFTGTDLADEIAVLLSLLTGRRLRAGGICRWFDSPNDPGRPAADPGVPPVPIPPPGHRLLPRQTMTCELLDDHESLLKSYSELSSDQAVALARAARSYRDAIWLGESHPELAWLLLVSAVECAANGMARVSEDDPLVRLRAARSPLARKIERLDVTVEEKRGIAKELAHLFKATDKFVGFLVHYAPKVGPQPRPSHGAFAWGDEEVTRSAFASVYSHRSAALHEALAIPRPMLIAPRRWEAGGGFDEVPIGTATGSLGASWTHDAIPMLLHTFEFIVQNALVAWWREMDTT